MIWKRVNWSKIRAVSDYCFASPKCGNELELYTSASLVSNYLCQEIHREQFQSVNQSLSVCKFFLHCAYRRQCWLVHFISHCISVGLTGVFFFRITVHVMRNSRVLNFLRSLDDPISTFCQRFWLHANTNCTVQWGYLLPGDRFMR